MLKLSLTLNHINTYEQAITGSIKQLIFSCKYCRLIGACHGQQENQREMK